LVFDRAGQGSLRDGQGREQDNRCHKDSIQRTTHRNLLQRTRAEQGEDENAAVPEVCGAFNAFCGRLSMKENYRA
jgi:hypothetical protein